MIVLIALLEKGVWHVVKKKKTNREFISRVGMDTYEMDDVIICLGSHVKIILNKS